jgi:hypothetical protein
MKRTVCIILAFVALTSKPMPVFGQANQPQKRCVLTLELKQAHYTLDLWTHLKDEMNAATFDIPVDRQFCASVKVGDVLTDQFRSGSLILRGSFGNWNVSVKGKRVH